MVREAEEFAAEDESQRKRIEAMNSLSNFVYGVKNQLADQEGLGGKLDDDDKKALLAIVKETTEWVESEGVTATLEEVEEKLQEVQAQVSPITSKVYSGGPSDYAPDPDDDDQEPFRSHDEL